MKQSSWGVTFKSFLALFFFTPVWDRKNRGVLSCLIALPLDQSIFPWGQAQPQNSLGVFQNDYNFHGCISEWLFSPPSIQSMWRFFYNICHEHLVGLLEIKFTKMLIYPQGWAPRYYLSSEFILNLQKLNSYHFIVPTSGLCS